MTEAAGAATINDDGNGRYRLGGTITMASVSRLRTLGLQAFARGSGAVELDLSGVARADSSSLALLIDWLAWARAAGRTMKFIGLPASLLALARLSDVEDLLAS